jgi:hypothetical protein
MTEKTRRQRKVIPTFTWLMRKAEALSRKKPEEFHNLLLHRTTELLRGASLHLARHHDGALSTFFLQRETKAGGITNYCRIVGFKDGGEFYTAFIPVFSATEYSQRMHKYLPFDLPLGSLSSAGPKWAETKPVIVLNADGSHGSTHHWNGGRRGKPGYATNGQGQVLPFVIRDRDGMFVGDNDDCRERFRSKITYMSGYYHSNPVDIQHGFLPGAVTSKIQWYDSMNNDNGLWFPHKMKALAARVHSEAIALSRKYPHIRIALYPMRRAGDYDPKMQTHHNNPNPSENRRFGNDIKDAPILGRDILDRPIRYFLPEIVAHWTIPQSIERGDGLRFIRVTIPPVGCTSLLRDDHNSSCFCRTFDLPDNAEGAGEWYPRVSSYKSRNFVPECAYHCAELICMSAEYWGKASIGYSRKSEAKHGESDADKVVHDWNKNQNAVMVLNHSADELDNDPKYEQTYAASPSGIFSCIEEKELMDSLPLV